MSSPQSGTPDSNFQERLNRVAAARAPIEAAKPQVDVLPDWKQNIRYPAALVLTALGGVVAVLIARYVRFHLMGGSLTGEDTDITMIIDGAIAAACSFLIFGMMRFREPTFKLAQTIGIAAGIMTTHNLVHAAPGLFDKVFSTEWTDEVIAYTEPNSILFRGVTFVLIEPETAVVAGDGTGASNASTPIVRRAGKL